MGQAIDISKKAVELTITRKLDSEKGDSMSIDVDIPGIGVAHFWVQDAGPVILRGKRGGIDFGIAEKPVIESYGLTPADTIEL